MNRSFAFSSFRFKDRVLCMQALKVDTLIQGIISICAFPTVVTEINALNEVYQVFLFVWGFFYFLSLSLSFFELVVSENFRVKS